MPPKAATSACPQSMYLPHQPANSPMIPPWCQRDQPSTHLPITHLPSTCVPGSAQRWLRSWTRSGAAQGRDLRAKLCAKPRGRGCVQRCGSPPGCPGLDGSQAEQGQRSGVLSCAASAALLPAEPGTFAGPQDATLLRHGRVLPHVGAGRWMRQRPAPTWRANSAEPLFLGGLCLFWEWDRGARLGVAIAAPRGAML